jgi:hypothetical protein
MIPPCAGWCLLATYHNDFGGGDYSGIVCDLFCGRFFTCSYGGALAVVLGPHGMSYAAWRWKFHICVEIIVMTIRIQAFRDEVGDKARGRHTLPIEMSRKPALVTVVLILSF